MVGLIGVRAFARLVGVTEGAIRKAIAEGKLDVAETTGAGWPRLDEEEALQAWRALHPEPSEGGESDAKLYWREHALLEQVKREKAQLDLQQQRGELHSADDVRAVMNGMLASFRARVLALPANMAPQLIGRTPQEIQAILSSEVHDILTELSDYDPSTFRKLKKA